MTNYKLTSIETTPDKLNENLDQIQGDGHNVHQIIPYAESLYGNSWDNDNEQSSDFQTTIKLIILYFVEMKEKQHIYDDTY